MAKLGFFKTSYKNDFNIKKKRTGLKCREKT